METGNEKVDAPISNVLQNIKKCLPKNVDDLYNIGVNRTNKRRYFLSGRCVYICMYNNSKHGDRSSYILVSKLKK